MPGQHTEKAFETYVSEILQTKAGWSEGNKTDWDKYLAVFPSEIVAFLKDTQPKLWNGMFSLHGTNLEALLVTTLAKELDAKGTLHIVRYGFKFYGKTFQMAYFKPAHGLNEETLSLYAKNRLTVTRQIPCHPKNNATVDLLFSTNGLPIATCELKNPSTGQTWRTAIEQYREDREPSAPLFKFKTRSLVHFAADPDEVYMTTKLSKKATSFLPFNRGSHPGEIQCGAGNPQHPSGYRTGYFWEEVLQRDSFLDLVGNFLFVEKKEEKILDKDGKAKQQIKETLVFPRYHQLDSVRKLVCASRTEKVGHNYLIQHSAGSGKTNSISWLSHRLASLHTVQDEKVFDCVIVITDRLDLQDDVSLQYYRLQRISSGPINLSNGDVITVKSPTDIGTGKATDIKAPLSAVITVLNDRFGTEFTEEDRLFFEQIKEKASNDQRIIETALANPKDKFKIGIRKLIEDLMIQRLGENDRIVTRYVADQDFQDAAFDGLADEIFDSVAAAHS